MHKHLPARLYCVVDELCCSLNFSYHLLAHLVIEIQAYVLDAFVLEVVFKLSGSIDNMRYSVSL